MNNESKKVIFITGTPGVGKTTLSDSLAKKLPAKLIKINELASEKELFLGIDEKKGYQIVDLDKLCEEIKEILSLAQENIVIESHLSHFCPGADMVIVLRLHPSLLEKRLKARAYNTSKIQENLEAEAMGICSSEAYENYGESVQEIDTSNLSPNEVLDVVIKVIENKKTFDIGNIDFLHWIISKNNK